MRAVAALALAAPAFAIDNGIGLLPPMGWRSWNCFGGDVSQPLMESIMDKMTERRLQVDGKPTSLADLGYLSVGLDDAWQACGTGWDGSFHTEDGAPLVNLTRFPNMTAMTAYGHAKNLKVGFYENNCICQERQFNTTELVKNHMVKTVAAIAAWGFDGVKLDGCGQFLNLTWWADLINATGRPMEIENCHWGQTTPGHTSATEAQTVTQVMHHGELRTVGNGEGPSQGDAPCSGTTTPSDCPYNFYRSSGDITNTWDSMHKNLRSTIPFLGEPPLSRPGTWAYPDMLEVGRMPSTTEDRTHFGAWVIVSSPLILGYDVRDDATTERVWSFIANPEAIAVSQTWAGHPGRNVITTSDWELWAKPLGGGKTAAFVINVGGNTASWSVKLSDLGITGSAHARDVWERKDLGTVSGAVNVTLGSHDSAFWVFTA